MVDRQEWSRRSVLVGGAKLAGAGALSALLIGANRLGTMAQDATPMTGDQLGFPELVVTITDDGYQLEPTSVSAGYILLTVHNATDHSVGAAVLGPGPGQTMADLQALASTPTASDEFPPFFYDITIPGGPGDAPAGGTAQAVIQLDAGDWVVWGDGDQPPSFFTATEGTPVVDTEPASDVTVTEQEFAFTGLEQTLPAGPQTWKVVNTGEQPHMLVLGKVPDDTTMDQVREVMNRAPDATPAAGALGENDFEDAGGVLMQSSGTTVWPRLDLAAGRYVALCFVPDPSNGMPHAAEGMITLFDVGSDAATPSA